MQQQNQQQGQQPLMMQPPDVITSKDLLYLKDQLSWQLNAMKKCAHYAQECQDQRVKQAIEKAGQMHQRHYEKLLPHLQTNNQSKMAQVQSLSSQTTSMQHNQQQQGQ